MELTRKDRVILINQYRILKRLEPEAARHYDELIEILERGYSMCYTRIEAALEESEIPEEVGQFVQDVFALYQAIEAYKAAHPDDQAVVSHPWASFRGFDSAAESDFLIFARFLAHHTGTEGFDSHAPTLAKYRILVAIYQALGAPAELCATGIRSVLGLETSAAVVEAEDESVETESEAEGESESEEVSEEAAAEESEAKPKPARKRKPKSEA